MVRSKDHFVEFKPHSKHKHLILKEYFSSWGHKLGLRPGAGASIVYVDACAGRGIDDAGNHGSPLIAARAAAIASASISGHRGTNFVIQVVAIEKGKAHFEKLRELLAPFGSAVRPLRGTLSDHLPELEKEFKGVPALFFIDPFGLEPLQAASIRTILLGERNEVLLLFADQAALRHFGAIEAVETRAEQRHRTAADELSLFPADAARDLGTLAEVAAESRETLEMTKARAADILTAAFDGGDWMPTIEATRQADRRAAFLRIYIDRLKSWGAVRVLPIPVVDETGLHAYTLIHVTKSPKGYAAMKEAVAKALKDSPLPESVVQRMRESLASNLDEIERQALDHFAGQEVRWAEDPADRRRSHVRQFALEQTTALPFELDALRGRLARLRLGGRVVRYKFPIREG